MVSCSVQNGDLVLCGWCEVLQCPITLPAVVGGQAPRRIAARHRLYEPVRFSFMGRTIEIAMLRPSPPMGLFEFPFQKKREMISFLQLVRTQDVVNRLSWYYLFN